MDGPAAPGWIVVLNGPPRSGKSSIVSVIQETFDGPWLNLGVDVFCQHVTPPRLRPGMGLRPGGGEIPEPVLRWQESVHDPGVYDLEVDTSAITPETAARLIQDRMAGPPTSAFDQVASTRA